jgi:hypothetical protein
MCIAGAAKLHIVLLGSLLALTALTATGFADPVPGFTFASVGPTTRSIAFVCDASGPMCTMNKMGALKTELNRAIDQLRVVQSFSLTFFSEGAPVKLDDHPLHATPDNKKKASEFLKNVQTSGQANPESALDLAFSQKPDLIFFLADGDFTNNDGVLLHVRLLQDKTRVKINTIALVGEGDTDTEFINVLKTIAEESGGTFKKVAPADLK